MRKHYHKCLHWLKHGEPARRGRGTVRQQDCRFQKAVRKVLKPK